MFVCDDVDSYISRAGPIYSIDTLVLVRYSYVFDFDFDFGFGFGFAYIDHMVVVVIDHLLS